MGMFEMPDLSMGDWASIYCSSVLSPVRFAKHLVLLDSMYERACESARNNNLITEFWNDRVGIWCKAIRNHEMRRYKEDCRIYLNLKCKHI